MNKKIRESLENLQFLNMYLSLIFGMMFIVCFAGIYHGSINPENMGGIGIYICFLILTLFMFKEVIIYNDKLKGLSSNINLVILSFLFMCVFISPILSFSFICFFIAGILLIKRYKENKNNG